MVECCITIANIQNAQQYLCQKNIVHLREKTEYSIIFAKVFIKSFAGFRGGLVGVFGLFCVGSLHEQEKKKDRVKLMILILILYDRKHPWT